MFAEGPEWRSESEADLCEQCGQEPATVHVVRVEGGDITQAHLCQDCAGEVSQQGGQPALVFALPLQTSGVNIPAEDPAPAVTAARRGTACPTCGTTYTDLEETGLVGCAGCYQVFGEYLTVAPSVAGEGAAERGHVGKTPHGAAGGVSERREVTRLSRMLRELVRTEQFEEAALVRDRLQELGHDPRRGAS